MILPFSVGLGQESSFLRGLRGVAGLGLLGEATCTPRAAYDVIDYTT